MIMWERSESCGEEDGSGCRGVRLLRKKDSARLRRSESRAGAAILGRICP